MYIYTMLLHLFKMSRPVNIVIAMVTLSIGYYLLSAMPTQDMGISWTTLVLQTLGFACAIGFANIQNDIWDLETDRLNRPERPLVSGKVPMGVAQKAWVVLLVLGIACGIAESLVTETGFTSAIFFVLLTVLLVAYNKWLKHIPLLKNMTVAFLCATPLILCLFYPTGLKASIESTLGISNKIGLLYPAMLFAFLLTTAREIYKDLEDETGDLKAGIMTFPLIAGAPTARRLAGLICLFTWAILPLPVAQGYYPMLFLIITGIAFTPAVIAILVFANKRNYRNAQKLVKIAMFAGLIALVVSC